LNNKWLLEAIDDIYETIHGPDGYLIWDLSQ
jgi:hypothetical protein